MTEHQRTGVPSELLLGTGLCLLGVVWSYWPAAVNLVGRWSDDPQASHGFLVPVVVALVLWYRWDLRPKSAPTSSSWGIAVLLFAGSLRFLGAYLNLDWLDEFSLLLTLVGCVLLIAGFAWLRWTAWGLVLLLFMIPLPFIVERGVASTLQRGATLASTYLLQTCGFPAVAEGNTITVGKARLGVLEACNGLGMLQSFLLLSAAMAMISRRPILERMFLFACGLPVALLANLVRITSTALLTLSTEAALHQQIHDVAGWLMIPLALLFLWLITKVLDHLWLVDPAVATRPSASRQPVACSLANGAGP